MTHTRSASPWVSAHQQQVGFALQLATVDTSADPGRHVLRSGQLAEALGFDAIFLPDHPSWLPDCWVHLAALAVTTSRIRLGPRGLRLVSAPGGAGATGRGRGSAERWTAHPRSRRRSGMRPNSLASGRRCRRFAIARLRSRKHWRSCAASGVRRRFHTRVAVFRRSMRRSYLPRRSGPDHPS